MLLNNKFSKVTEYKITIQKAVVTFYNTKKSIQMINYENISIRISKKSNKSNKTLLVKNLTT